MSAFQKRRKVHDEIGIKRREISFINKQLENLLPGSAHAAFLRKKRDRFQAEVNQLISSL
jgi:hypothetical protein